MRFTIACVATLLGILVGCDGAPPTTSQTESEPPPPEAQSDRPTTRELVSGPQLRVALQNIPFSVKAPKGWKVAPARGSGVPTLAGPTPTGDAQVQIERPPVPDDKYAERFLSGAKRLATQPNNRETVTFRQVGPAQLVEMRSFGQTHGYPAIDSTGHQIAPTSTSMNWRVTAFVTSNGAMQAYQISFVDLTREQYERDKDLLEMIIASLEYDSTASQN
ncbi:MAG: hypothetical protein ACREJC_18305 [Tepidisphaeraceae bacterium]